MVRLCGAPGCTLRDYHLGPCSFMDCDAKRRRFEVSNGSKLNTDTKKDDAATKTVTKSVTCRNCGLPGHNIRTCAKKASKIKDLSKSIHKTGNMFQVGRDVVRECMKYQIGVSFETSTSLLNGFWLNENDRYYMADFCITGVPSDSKGNVASGICSDGVEFEFPSAIFTAKDTIVNWKTVDPSILQRWRDDLQNEVHENSIFRAHEFMREYLSLCGLPSKDEIVIMLDGNGENRKGMYDALKEADIDEENWPQILTFDLDPDVVLANRLLFRTNDIIFTGCDQSFKSKSLAGNGTLLEHLILKENMVLTYDMKERVKAVYFDYCGGPPLNQKSHHCRANFKCVLSCLPALKLYGVTMSYRKHGTLRQHGIEHFVVCPKGFHLSRTFDANKKVLCQFFTERSDFARYLWEKFEAFQAKKQAAIDKLQNKIKRKKNQIEQLIEKRKENATPFDDGIEAMLKGIQKQLKSNHKKLNKIYKKLKNRKSMS